MGAPEPQTRRMERSPRWCPNTTGIPLTAGVLDRRLPAASRLAGQEPCAVRVVDVVQPRRSWADAERSREWWLQSRRRRGTDVGGAARPLGRSRWSAMSTVQVLVIDGFFERLFERSASDAWGERVAPTKRSPGTTSRAWSRASASGTSGSAGRPVGTAGSAPTMRRLGVAIGVAGRFGGVGAWSHHRRLGRTGRSGTSPATSHHAVERAPRPPIRSVPNTPVERRTRRYPRSPADGQG